MGISMTKNKRWEQGNKAYYWTPNTKYIKRPLCLQSKEYNHDMKGVTWVYYSKSDAKKLYKFLKGIFE